MRKVALLILASLPALAQYITLSPARMTVNPGIATFALVWASGWNSGVPGITSSFTAQTSITIAHPFGSYNVKPTCVDGTGKFMAPRDWTASALGLVIIYFDSATTGRCFLK